MAGGGQGGGRDVESEIGSSWLGALFYSIAERAEHPQPTGLRNRLTLQTAGLTARGTGHLRDQRGAGGERMVRGVHGDCSIHDRKERRRRHYRDVGPGRRRFVFFLPLFCALFCTCISAGKRGQRWQAPTCKEVLVVEVDVEKACARTHAGGYVRVNTSQEGTVGRVRERERERAKAGVCERERKREREVQISR